MAVNPWQRDGEWLRCALHAHTTNSDGDLAPAELVRRYESHGYDVLAITDHWVRTVEASTERLLVLPGTELNALLPSGVDAHVLAVGVTADPELPEERFPDLPATVGWVLANGGVPYVAHTYWSGLRPEEFEDCDGLLGLEVYNTGCELELGRGLASLHWDETLERGRPLFGLAVDDSHHPDYDSGLAWVWARCERSPDGVLGALRDGSFYSSTGPVVEEVVVEEGAVVVRCSPASSVTLFAGRWKGARVNAGPCGFLHRGEVLETRDGLVVAARLRRPARAVYGRVEVTAPDGTAAWTNPLWP